MHSKLFGVQPANYSNYTCYRGLTNFRPPYIDTVGYVFGVILGLQIDALCNYCSLLIVMCIRKRYWEACILIIFVWEDIHILINSYMYMMWAVLLKLFYSEKCVFSLNLKLACEIVDKVHSVIWGTQNAWFAYIAFFNGRYRVFLGANQYFVASDVGSGKMQWYAFHKEAPMNHDPPGGKSLSNTLSS